MDRWLIKVCITGAFAVGTINDEERFDVVRHACPGAGACGGMYTYASSSITLCSNVYRLTLQASMSFQSEHDERRTRSSRHVSPVLFRHSRFVPRSASTLQQYAFQELTQFCLPIQRRSRNVSQLRSTSRNCWSSTSNPGGLLHDSLLNRCRDVNTEYNLVGISSRAIHSSMPSS